jgi:CheY-like chemotaxis protein
VETTLARRILVVEDSDDAREVLTELLELAGHQVVAVADGLTAVQHASLLAPDVVLVDIGLPGIDGFEVARRLRQALGQAPFLVALTGHARDEDREEALAAGFDLHLVKPVDVARLERIVAGDRRAC